MSTLKITVPGLPSPGGNLPFLRKYTMAASDSFSGAAAADINGRVTDSALGGSPKTWQAGPANSYAITNGLLTRGTQMSVQCGAALNVGDSGLRTRFVIAEIGSGSIYLDHRKAVPDLGGAPTAAYRLRVTGRTVDVLRTGSGTVMTYANPLYVGDSVGLEIVGGDVALLVNGDVVASYVDPAPLIGAYLEIFQGATSTIFLDALTVESAHAVG